MELSAQLQTQAAFTSAERTIRTKCVRGGMGPATDLDKLTPSEESLFPREIEKWNHSPRANNQE